MILFEDSSAKSKDTKDELANVPSQEKTDKYWLTRNKEAYKIVLSILITLTETKRNKIADKSYTIMSSKEESKITSSLESSKILKIISQIIPKNFSQSTSQVLSSYFITSLKHLPVVQSLPPLLFSLSITLLYKFLYSYHHHKNLASISSLNLFIKIIKLWNSSIEAGQVPFDDIDVQNK
jgi:hypothetical protein